VQIGRRGFLLFSVALCDEQENLVLCQRRLDRGQRCRPADEQRNDYIGKDDDVTKRQDRNPVRRRNGLVVPLEGLGQPYASFFRLIGEISSIG
jgi:hypothetical protein